MEEDQPDPRDPGNPEEEMDMDRTHLKEAKEQHHSASLEVESTGEEKAWAAQKHLEERYPSWDGKDRL